MLDHEIVIAPSELAYLRGWYVRLSGGAGIEFLVVLRELIEATYAERNRLEGVRKEEHRIAEGPGVLTL